MKVPVGHMVACQNIEKMGRLPVEDEACRVFANKPVKDLIGKTVWTFTGTGRPRKYSGASVFEREEVGKTGKSGFPNFVAGPGHCFQPPLALNDLDWFGAFLKKVGRFGFGLQVLHDPQMAHHLEELGREACYKACRWSPCS